MMKNKVIEIAKNVLKIEAESILALTDRIDDSFVKAVEMMLACKGKVVVTGIGKSGQIARKLSSTLSSTGTPALYLHPAESSHGDLGVLTEQDIVIAISYGGEAIELNSILNFISRRGIKLIAMTGKLQSTLAKASDVVLNIAVEKEACPLNLAPTPAVQPAPLAKPPCSIKMYKGTPPIRPWQHQPHGAQNRKPHPPRACRWNHNH